MHTPGPWVIDQDNARDINASDGELLATAYLMEERAKDPEGDDGGIGRANARLIATAPDLLEALRRLANESQGFLAMADRETHGNTNIAVLRNHIKAAFDCIAKAEGRPEKKAEVR